MFRPRSAHVLASLDQAHATWFSCLCESLESSCAVFCWHLNKMFHLHPHLLRVLPGIRHDDDIRLRCVILITISGSIICTISRQCFNYNLNLEPFNKLTISFPLRTIRLHWLFNSSESLVSFSAHSGWKLWCLHTQGIERARERAFCHGLIFIHFECAVTSESIMWTYRLPCPIIILLLERNGKIKKRIWSLEPKRGSWPLVVLWLWVIFSKDWPRWLECHSVFYEEFTGHFCDGFRTPLPHLYLFFLLILVQMLPLLRWPNLRFFYVTMTIAMC